MWMNAGVFGFVCLFLNLLAGFDYSPEDSLGEQLLFWINGDKEIEPYKMAGCSSQLQSWHMESSSLGASLFPPGMKIQSHFMWLHLDCSLSCRLCGSLFPRPMYCLSWSPPLKQKRRCRLAWLEVCSITALTPSISPVGLFSCHLSPPCLFDESHLLRAWWWRALLAFPLVQYIH